MSRIHPAAFNSPLPTDLESALEEILKLRSILIREREALANIAVKGEQDRRSITGNFKAAQQEIAELREQVKELHTRIKNAGIPDPVPQPVDPLKN